MGVSVGLSAPPMDQVHSAHPTLRFVVFLGLFVALPCREGGCCCWGVQFAWMLGFPAEYCGAVRSAKPLTLPVRGFNAMADRLCEASSSRSRNSYIWWESWHVILEVQFTWGCKWNLYEAWLFLSPRAAHFKVRIIYEIAASRRISTSSAYYILHRGVCRLLKAVWACKRCRHFNTFSVH